MPTIFVLVAATSADIKAEGIAAAVHQRPDMLLVGQRVARAEEIAELLDTLPATEHCGLVLVGPHDDTQDFAALWLARRKNLVVLRVNIFDDVVRIAARDVGLDPVLTALRDLVKCAGSSAHDRLLQFEFRPANARVPGDIELPGGGPAERPLFTAATDWISAVLRIAVARQSSGQADFPGLTVATSAVSDSLDPASARVAPAAVADAEDSGAALARALASADEKTEPLAAIARRLQLDDLEFRLLLLAIGPELDARYQRGVGLLMDDLSRRAGTLGLYSGLLGQAADTCRHLARTGTLARWRLLEGPHGSLGHADEPLRTDLPLLGLILGAPDALSQDPRIRRTLRLLPWPGAGLLDNASETASGLMMRLRSADKPRWLILAGESPAWFALLERGAADAALSPIRVELARLGGTDIGEVEETAIRLARMVRLTGRPLVIDATGSDDNREQDDAIRMLLSVAGRSGSSAAVVTRNAARIVRLLGMAPCEIEAAPPQTLDRATVMQIAAAAANCELSRETAEAIASKHPMQIDQLEQAMRLARATARAGGPNRFIAACREVSAEGVSHLAERIEPLFKLEDIVLPGDKKAQLEEIIDNVRLAPRVLDDWKFRGQLPYGRGVTALFHGPSGTGKTMAALGLANALDIQIMRIDLSRIVSKYIGDTEKNIDRVFIDAQNSGAALLIDEADALLGKRSEVKDAHDRYANIEVAYLLQRMEAFDGLAILTTNLRQNVDASFLRRMRFIVDFPRPDVGAREQIWRQCLPADAHELDDVAFRQLARKVDLTGGHVRQITLRAAFLAAAANSKINFDHVAQASRSEFAKLGLPSVEFDIAERRRAA